MPGSADQQLADLVDRIVAFCPLPDSAQRVLALTNDPDVDIRDIARIVSADPALAAEVMRIANSAAFARGSPVADLVHAILKLGLRELREMSAAMALLAVFRTKSELTIELHASAVLSGAIAQKLAARTKAAPPGTAFVSGLLCEIGAMACIAVDGRQYLDVWKVSGGDWEARRQLEQECYGHPTPEIGAAILKRHELPDVIVNSVGAWLGSPRPPTGPLDRITVFARHAAPLLIETANAGARSLTDKEVAVLANEVGLVGVAGADVAVLCLEADGEIARVPRRA